MQEFPNADRRHGGIASRWWPHRSIRTKGLLIVAVPLVGIVTLAAVGLVVRDEQAEQRRDARTELDLVTTSSEVLAQVVNAETGVRGFAAPGNDPVYLDRYDRALARIDADRAALRAAAEFGDQSMYTRVDATTVDVLAKLAELRTAIAAEAPDEQLAADLRVEMAAMDRLRREVAQLIEGPAAGLVAHRETISELETRIRALNLVGVILTLLGGLAAVALFTSHVTRRLAAAESSAARLGRGLPIEAATSSGDELDRLDQALLVTETRLETEAGELNASRDAALGATEAKNAFLSHTSHELRTPLNSILGFAQLLELSDLDADDRDSVTWILAAGRHLLALVNELIDIARIESGDLNLSLEPVAVPHVVGQVVDLLAPLASERSIVVVARCPHPRLTALADEQRLTQVMVNLLSNAVKYSRRGGVISIGCRANDEDLVSVNVSDTGRGIAAGDLERIFLPFERLNDNEEVGEGEVVEGAVVEGTGIGLPLARALTEAMGGTLTATSEVGVGSNFTVTLPRAPDVEPDTHDHPTEMRRPTVRKSTAPAHVVYIEDNQANIEVVDRYLRSRPATRFAAYATGRAGVDAINDDRPDLVLLDLHLPGMSGTDVLAELRREPTTATIPVVILSADASPGVVRRLLAAGAAAFLTKPIDFAALSALLDALVPDDDTGRLPLGDC